MYCTKLNYKMIKIKNIPNLIDTIKSMGNIINTNGENYYNLPQWFKKTDDESVIEIVEDSDVRTALDKIIKDIGSSAMDRFKMPTSEQLLDICVLFNDGVLNAEKLADMLSPLQFVLDRLFENGDVLIPSKKEE